MDENYNPNNNQQPMNQNTVQGKKKKKKTVWIVLGVIAVLLILFIILGSGGKDDPAPDTGSDTTTNQKVENSDKKKSPDTVGDFKCKVKSAKKAKDWEGKDSVIITYEFTNNSEEAQSFDIALIDSVYQDGIQLESTFNSDDDTDTFDIKIKPGTTKDVNKMYVLRNSTSKLEIEIEELISFSDDKITATVEF